MATLPDEALEEAEVDPNSDRLREVFDRAIRRFDDAVLPQQEQRALALAARRFASIPGAQWEGDWGETWANSIKVEINKVAKGVEKIVSDYRANRIVPDFRPSGGNSDQDSADTLDGMHRADSYHFKAQQARDNAFEEGAAGGFGAYRLTTEWADPLDKDSDELRINPAMIIVDADQRVFFDPNSKLYDKSDARFGFVLTAYSPEAFKDDFGEDKAVSWDDPKLRPSQFDWYAPEVVIAAEYYELEEKTEKLLIFTHRLTEDEQRWWQSEIEASEVSDLEKQGWTKRTQTRQRKRIHKYVLSGQEVLKDQGLLAGSEIPVVPFYGKRWYIDNQERFAGYVQPRMDRQRVYNSQISRLAETSALSPREKPIFLAEQMPPSLAALWQNQEVDRHPYALVNPVLDPVTGGIAAMGAVGKIEPPQVDQVAAALIQITGNDLVEDMQEPDEVVANTSAEAMDIAATRVDAKSAIYLDNWRQSVQREGEIYLSQCRDIYWQPGRKVETMSEEGDDGEATLVESYTDKSGRHSVRNDFAAGKYKVIVDVTEATTTRRGKAVKGSLAIAAAASEAGNPQLANIAILTAVMNHEGEGTAALQKWARKQLVVAGVEEPTDDEKQQMEEAAQQQQPDPTAALAEAAAAEKAASAKLKGAQTIEAMASAQLKGAQAEAVGGPDAPPPVPDGLEQAGKVVDIRHKLAQTAHLQTETALLPREQSIEAHKADTARMTAEMRPRIRKGNEL